MLSFCTQPETVSFVKHVDFFYELDVSLFQVAVTFVSFALGFVSVFLMHVAELFALH